MGRTRKYRRSLGRNLRGHIWLRDNKTCRYCRKEIRTLASAQIDYVVPVSQGAATMRITLCCRAAGTTRGRVGVSPTKPG